MGAFVTAATISGPAQPSRPTRRTTGDVMNRILRGVDPAIFLGSALLICAFVGWGIFAPESLGSVMSTSLGWVIRNFGWAFVLIAFGVLALCIFLVISPWGAI